MFYNRVVDELNKLYLLLQYSRFEQDETSVTPLRNNQDVFRELELVNILQKRGTIYAASLPDGGFTKLLKIVLSSYCENNCNYCAFRSHRDFQRTAFNPEEFSDFFMKLYRKKYVEGLFLSSGIIGNGVCTQDRLIKTSEILRNKHQYKGYLHLKIMPGCDFEQVKRSMELADRVSINLEGATDHHLRELAPDKNHIQELIERLNWVEKIRTTIDPVNAWNNTWPSSATQFVVGAVGENDVDLLHMSENLYKVSKLRRTYFSGFGPVSNTPFESKAPVNPVRNNRLYQASYLIRDYGFCFEDLEFTSGGFLPLSEDPKKLWADKTLRENPIEINRADLETLMRVPGIGRKGAMTIIKARRENKLTDISQLKKLGVLTKRANPYILLNGKSELIQQSFSFIQKSGKNT